MIFKIMIDLLKRLYVKTKWRTPLEVKTLEKVLRSKGLLFKPKNKMVHYKPKEFGGKLDDEVPIESATNKEHDTNLEHYLTHSKSYKKAIVVASEQVEGFSAPIDCQVSNKRLTNRSMKASMLNIPTASFKGDQNAGSKRHDSYLTTTEGDEFEDHSDYNIYFHASADIKRYIEHEFIIKSASQLKKHYLKSAEFCDHPCMELTMKIYS